MQVECLVAAAAARLGEALLREDGLTGGNAVCHQGIEERRAVVRHADTRMIVQVTADPRKVDFSNYPSLIRILRRADAGAQQNGGGAVGTRT